MPMPCGQYPVVGESSSSSPIGFGLECLTERLDRGWSLAWRPPHQVCQCRPRFISTGCRKVVGALDLGQAITPRAFEVCDLPWIRASLAPRSRTSFSTKRTRSSYLACLARRSFSQFIVRKLVDYRRLEHCRLAAGGGDFGAHPFEVFPCLARFGSA